MLDTRLIQQNGTLSIDPLAARRVAAAHLEAAQLEGDQIGPTAVSVTADGQRVVVQVSVRVPHLMMRAVPGAPDDELLVVTATGRLAP